MRVRRFVERSAVSFPELILDVGCGTGKLLAALLERYPRAHYFALCFGLLPHLEDTNAARAEKATA